MLRLEGIKFEKVAPKGMTANIFFFKFIFLEKKKKKKNVCCRHFTFDKIPGGTG